MTKQPADDATDSGAGSPVGLDAASLQAGQALLADARRVVVLTGAGVSTDSGIPDFRGPQGVWTKNPKAERTSDIRYYMADPEVRELAWQTRLNTPIWQAKPNPAHDAITRLDRRGVLDTLVTQNIDGLHHDAGVDPQHIVEVHGTVRWTRCMQCDDRRSMRAALDRVRAGEADPSCEVCDGIIKSDTISFGQALRPETIDRAFEAAARADLLIAAGSTLSVRPVANMLPIASQAGVPIIIANGGPTDLDKLATVLVTGPLSVTLPALIGD